MSQLHESEIKDPAPSLDLLATSKTGLSICFGSRNISGLDTETA